MEAGSNKLYVEQNYVCINKYIKNISFLRDQNLPNCHNFMFIYFNRFEQNGQKT